MRLDFTPTLDKIVVLTVLMVCVFTALLFHPEADVRTWLMNIGSGMAGALGVLVTGSKHSDTKQENNITAQTVNQPVDSQK